MVKTPPCHIASLSNDVLLEILETSLPAFQSRGAKDYHSRLAILKHVCQHWQRLIDETASFHAKILIPPPPGALHRWIKLSKESPLHLVSDWSQKGEFTLDMESTLLEHKMRWRTLWLDGSSWELPLEKLLQTTLPALHTVCLSVDEASAGVLLQGLSSGWLPKLRTLKLAGPIDISLGSQIGAFKGLKSLEISSFTGTPSYMEMIELMKLSPELARLHLKAPQVAEGLHFNSEPLSAHLCMPRLDSLVLSIPGFPVNEFLQGVYLPICQEIDVTVQSPPCWLVSVGEGPSATSPFSVRLLESLSRLPLVEICYHGAWSLSEGFLLGQGKRCRLALAYSGHPDPLAFIGSIVKAASVPCVFVSSLQSNLNATQIALLVQIPNIDSMSIRPMENELLWRHLLVGFSSPSTKVKLSTLRVNCGSGPVDPGVLELTLRPLFDSVNLATDTARGVQATTVNFLLRIRSSSSSSGVSPEFQKKIEKFFGCQALFSISYFSAPVVINQGIGQTSNIDDID